MADHVLKLMKETDDYQKKEEIFFDFLKAVNKKEFDFFDIEYITMNRNQKKEFIDSVERDGIFIHQPPFFENTSMEDFIKIFKDHPEWCTPYKFVGIENPLVMGDIYFVRLKHESGNKMSLRNASNLNTKGLPSKSTLKKEKKTLVSSTPIKLGEMEITNLFLTKEPKVIEKLLKSYSTNKNLREETIMQLLNPGKENGKRKNVLDMDLDLSLDNNSSIPNNILERYLNLLGYTIINDNIEEKEDKDI